MPDHTLPPGFYDFTRGYDWTAQAYRRYDRRAQLFDDANMGDYADLTCNITPVGAQGDGST